MLTKKKIIIIIVSAVVVVAIAVSTALILKNISSDTADKKPAVSQQTADDLKDEAIKALKDDDAEAAKKIFEEAKAQYIQLDDVNGETDMEAQIYLIEHAKK
jgi:outer membrane protein assembly factor BamD (BamD/ComL family)